MKTNKFEHFLHDLISLQIEALNKRQKELQTCKPNDQDYIRGQIMAYYDSLTVIRDQAQAFDINLPLLADHDLEQYLRS